MTRPAARSLSHLTCVLLLSFGLAACGDSDEPDGSDTPATVESTGALPDGILSPDELRTALIASADIPSDYEEVEPEDDEEDSDLFDGTCLEGVQDFSDQVGSEPVSEAETEFSHQDGDGEAQILSGIGAFADQQALTEGITAFGDSLAACPSVTRTDDDGVTYDFEVAADDEVTVAGADQQLYVTLDGTITAGPEGLRLSFGILLTRIGPYAARVGTAELGSDHGLAEQITALATLQTERLVDLAR